MGKPNYLESQISDAVVKGNKIYENLNDQDISTLETTTDLKDVAAFKITDLNKKLRGGKISQDAYDLSITGFKEEYKQDYFFMRNYLFCMCREHECSSNICNPETHSKVQKKLLKVRLFSLYSCFV